MKQRILTLLLALGCITLGAIGLFVHVSQDHTAPEIKVKKKEITYTEGENYDALMKGISARDNIDGDLSDEVFVDKIVPLGDGKAIVYYGVMDKHHNVGTARRKINYIMKEMDSEEPEAEENTQEGVEAETGDNADESTGEDDTPLEPNGVRPVMALTETETVINAGETFDALSVVRDVVDDKDDKDTLYQHIHADGEYDTAVPGVYEIRYYVSDSDGNTSEPHIFTLTVQ